ncbi:hypothetical protein [Lactobacillus sp. ESL0228]|jgi:purine-cytosine permease-like protein|uniref:hypothetical protein n=1 Tax=Lactobacillus sp. ESL0228 TaxID=2069352 RepID=UPI000EFD5D81|nr:hypothetical protein [Lactobacillus sp. ESL0228]RMC48672.1 hypothetical protein F5ESL0228_03470 [Lactobacillus sp. ESL0228]
MLKVVISIYLVVLLIAAWYLWQKRNDHFLIYNNQNKTNFTSIMAITAIALIADSLIGFCILLQDDKYLNFITLILSCLTILFFGLAINQKDE